MSDVQQPGGTPRPKMDRRIKLAFVAVVVAAGVLLQMQQRQGPDLKGWGTDFNEAAAKAAGEKKLLLALFLSSPTSQADRDIVDRVINKNKTFLAATGMILVKAPLDDALKTKYAVKATPTLLVLDPNGNPLARYEELAGKKLMGETDLPKFLQAATRPALP